MATELLPNIKQREWSANGVPLAGGKLYSYEAGTSTPLATYVDQAGTTPNTNPIIFDANGQADIFITSGVQYKFVLTDANDVVQWTKDNVSGVGFSGNLGTGDVVGPAASVNNELSLFSGTTGKVLKRASGTGFVKATAGVVSYATDIDLSSEVTGVLGIPEGGTGESTAQAAIDALLPSQTGNASKFLKTDGTNASWAAIPGITELLPLIYGDRNTPVDVDTNGVSIASGYYLQIAFVQGDGGAVTVTANPQITINTAVGARCILILRDASKPITFSDGNGLSLRGGPLVMDVLDQVAEFVSDGTAWVYAE